MRIRRRAAVFPAAKEELDAAGRQLQLETNECTYRQNVHSNPRRTNSFCSCSNRAACFLAKRAASAFRTSGREPAGYTIRKRQNSRWWEVLDPMDSWFASRYTSAAQGRWYGG